MNYRAKRKKAGLSAYTMSKELGIAYDKYLLVEKKMIPLEGEYVDKFMKILDRAKEIIFNRKQRIHEIDEFIEDGSLREVAQKRGYNRKELAEATGISTAEVSKTFTGKQTNQDTKERIFDFLLNPINLNVKSEQKTVVENDFEFDGEEIRKIMKERGMFAKDIASAIGISTSYVCKILNSKDPNEFKEQKKVIKDFMNGFYTTEMPTEEPAVEEAPVVEVIEETEEVATPIVTSFKFAQDGVYIGNTDKDYFEVLKENHELKEKLARAEHQIQMYEKLIERL